MEAADAGLSRAEPSSDAESEDAYACDSNAPSVPLPSLIVLDIDGVLNTHSLASSDDDAYRWHHIDASLDLKVRQMDLVLSRSRARAFCSLARTHRCQIVMSTSWRVEPVACRALRAAFADHGLAETVIIGSTPELRRSTRAREIQAWLIHTYIHTYIRRRGSTRMAFLVKRAAGSPSTTSIWRATSPSSCRATLSGPKSERA